MTIPPTIEPPNQPDRAPGQVPVAPVAALLQSPLQQSHSALGATMGAFGGWNMPISYAGGGVVAEHTAVRTTVGIFDVSHLGKVGVNGPGAAAFVNDCLTADLTRIRPGQAQYSLCCNAGGGVIDDLIAYLVSQDEVFLVPNAANTVEVVTALQRVAPAGIEVTLLSREFGVLAVQGPLAGEVLTAVGLPTELDYMSWVDTSWVDSSPADADGPPSGSVAVRVCRTGYTGEYGFELLPGWDDTVRLWNALARAAEERGGRPAGLGARDTLRTEMGYPLHGQDLGPDITPVQAGSGWAVGWTKPAFFGRDALLAEKASGPLRRLRGLEALGRGVLRPRLRVLDADGNPVGQTTSGTFSPTLGRGIGLALLDSAAEITDGDELSVDVRGRALRVRVVRPPFVASSVR